MTTTEIFNQVVETEKIDINSKFRLEKTLCVDKMIEKLFSLGFVSQSVMVEKIKEYETFVQENFTK
jgi:hypothetical protein